MAQIERYAGWLSCPECERDLEPLSATTVACSSGHRFDVGARGYLALLTVGTRVAASRSRGRRPDPDRAADFGSVVHAMAPRARRILTVADDSVGIRPVDASGWLLSDSPALLAATASGTAGVLADLHRRWPVRDGSTDALIAAGTDPFPAEAHRVLAPGGLVVTIASDDAVGALLDDLFPWFEHDQTRPLADTGRTALRLRRRRRILTW